MTSDSSLWVLNLNNVYHKISNGHDMRTYELNDSVFVQCVIEIELLDD